MFDESDLVYSKEHEWVFIDDDIAWVGITKYAVKNLAILSTLTFHRKMLL